MALWFLLPLYIAFVTSVDTRADVFRFPPHLIPDFDFHPYVAMWHMAHWSMYFRNTALITGITVAIALTTSVLAAYAFVYLKFPGRQALFFVTLIVLMVPSEALLIPNYVILHQMHLLNTLWAQILPFGGSVFGVFLLRQFFLTLPTSYWDAARIDGASHLQFLWSVVLPLAKPVLLTIGLYIGIGCWNSFQWPLIVTVSHNVQPIEVAVQRLMSSQSVDWRRLSAAGLMATMPLIAIFVALQKHILRGMSRTSGLQE
ncbi:MAG: carbohydrate ABC transporter permease [Firmicutes bacterium]|nr:carbohydrate ABC transporter permease [Bacillota bacterium]